MLWATFARLEDSSCHHIRPFPFFKRFHWLKEWIETPPHKSLRFFAKHRAETAKRSRFQLTSPRYSLGKLPIFRSRATTFYLAQKERRCPGAEYRELSQRISG